MRSGSKHSHSLPVTLVDMISRESTAGARVTNSTAALRKFSGKEHGRRNVARVCVQIFAPRGYTLR